MAGRLDKALGLVHALILGINFSAALRPPYDLCPLCVFMEGTMGSIRRWRVNFFDKGRRVETSEHIEADGEPNQILKSLRERYPSRLIHSVCTSRAGGAEGMGLRNASARHIARESAPVHPAIRARASSRAASGADWCHEGKVRRLLQSANTRT